MSFLTLSNSTTTLTIRVKSNAATQNYEYHRRDLARMFDGTVRETRGGVFRDWPLTTKLSSQGDYVALVSMLTGPDVPLTANGDLTDGEDVFVHPTLTSASPTQTA